MRWRIGRDAARRVHGGLRHNPVRDGSSSWGAPSASLAGVKAGGGRRIAKRLLNATDLYSYHRLTLCSTPSLTVVNRRLGFSIQTCQLTHRLYGSAHADPLRSFLRTPLSTRTGYVSSRSVSRLGTI